MICEVQNVDDVTNLSPENYNEKFAHEHHQLEYEIDETESGYNVVAPKVHAITHKACITAYASGTGLAGVVGYGYKALLTEYLGWGLSSTIWSAIAFALAYSLIYLNGLHGLEQCMQQSQSKIYSNLSITFVSEHGISDSNPIHNPRHNDTLEMITTDTTHLATRETTQINLPASSLDITASERFKLVLSLWPYTIPLFTVYAAEYSIQAGVWSAIGFPVTSASARAEFYQYSNWAVSALDGNFWMSWQHA
jgi:battenin